MTRGIAKIHAKSRHFKQRKRDDMKKLKVEMEVISKERRGMAADSRKIVRKKLQVEMIETELAKVKVQMRDSSESLMAAKKAAARTEAEFAALITTRNELMDNLIKEKNKLLEMKAIEAILMLELGFL